MAADARRVDPDYSQEADCLILEYLLHNATNALLEAYEGDLSFFSPKHGPRKRKWPELRKDSAGDVETHLMMVDSFLQVFNKHHPDYEASTTMPPDPNCNEPYEHSPNQIAFRLKLLKFATLYTAPQRNGYPRPTHSQLKDLRGRNRRRAEEWYALVASDEAHSSVYYFLGDLWRYLEGVQESGGEAVDRSPIDPPVTALLDLLPLFIELTTARARMHKSSNAKHEALAFDWDTAPQWLELAGEMMCRAAIEDHASRGRTDVARVRDAFAWGPRIHRNKDKEYGLVPDSSPTLSGRQILEHDNLNEIFRMDTPESQIRPVDNFYLVTAEAWLKVLDAKIHTYIDWRNLHSGPTAGRHLPKHVTDRHSFDQQMTSYLRSLQASLDKPLLMQLEDESVRRKAAGLEIDGMKLNAAESESLLKVWRGEKR